MFRVRLDKKGNESAVRETLSRLGVGNNKRNILYPSVYLIELRGNNYPDSDYFLCHFKELFPFTDEDKTDDMTQEDFNRLLAITMFLKNWDLLSVDDKEYRDIDLHQAPFITIVKHYMKLEWVISHKINLRQLEKNQRIISC